MMKALYYHIDSITQKNLVSYRNRNDWIGLKKKWKNMENALGNENKIKFSIQY